MGEERIFFKQDENSVRNFLTFVFLKKCFGVFFFFHTIISFNSISISLESTKHQSDFIQQLKIYFNWFSFGFVEKSWINSGRLRIDRVFLLWFMLCMLILNVSLCWCCSKIGSNETVLKNHFQSLLFHCRLFGVHVECWMKILILIWFSLLLAWLLAWQMNRAMKARLKAKPAEPCILNIFIETWEFVMFRIPFSCLRLTILIKTSLQQLKHTVKGYKFYFWQQQSF